MRRFIEQILGRFQFVRSLRTEVEGWKKQSRYYEDKANENGLLALDYKRVGEDERKKHNETKRERDKLQIDLDLLVEEALALEAHADYLQEELGKYQRQAKPAVQRDTTQTWRCSCPVTHPFYVVACSVCSRTRPPAITSSPSAV